MKGLTVLFFGGIVSCGCTSMRSPPPPGPDHPASADAASSPMPSPSQTLAQRDAVAVPPDGASSTPMRMTDGATSDMGTSGHDMRSPMTVTTQSAAASTYACPMHPDVTSNVPGKCPKCGMKLVKNDAGGNGAR